MRSTTLAELTDRLGSASEARWILEQAGDGWPELVERRLAGEPLQYVLGSWSFRHLELVVDPRVLIPRPETEQVVEVALAELGRLCGSVAPRGGRPDPGRVCVDLGTGSGAIALALASEGRAFCPALQVWAADRSADALDVARENLARIAASGEIGSVHLVEGDWFEALPPALAGRIDLLVANPPYVPEEAVAALEPVVRDWEPRQALIAGPGRSGVPGMSAIEAIIHGAPNWLRPEGAMVIELDPSQAPAAAGLAGTAGFAQIRVERDLTGRERVLAARR